MEGVQVLVEKQDLVGTDLSVLLFELCFSCLLPPPPPLLPLPPVSPKAYHFPRASSAAAGPAIPGRGLLVAESPGSCLLYGSDQSHTAELFSLLHWASQAQITQCRLSPRSPPRTFQTRKGLQQVKMEFWTWNHTLVYKSSMHLVAPASEERNRGEKIKNLEIKKVEDMRKVGA